MPPQTITLRTCLRLTNYTAWSVFAGSMAAACYYRPLDDRSSQNDTPQATTPEARLDYYRTRRSEETFCSSEPSPWSREHVPVLLEWSRWISIGLTTLAIRLFMNTYGHYNIRDDEHYRHFLEVVLGDRRSQGLVTVSNHRSLFDDPGVVSCLLPLHVAVVPKYNRWGICSQEYCFNQALPAIVKGYIGAGQVLPICRGAGVDQKLFFDFARHLATGEWVHIFPEGGVWQWDELGGRRQYPPGAVSSIDFSGNSGETSAAQVIKSATSQQRALPLSSKGKLKWGVAKLIAHSPITPEVIPFAHHGMEKLLPQDEQTGKTKLRKNILLSCLPQWLGGEEELRVSVQFGESITFEDLINEHERQHGKLWKYKNDEASYLQWSSSVEERLLYNKITRRIEARLDELTKELCKGE